MDAKKPGAREGAPGLRVDVKSDQLEAGQGGVTWMAMGICGTEDDSNATPHL